MSQISRPALGLGLLLSLAFASASLPLLALNPPVPEGPVVPVATTAPWSAPPAVAFLPGGDLLLAANSPADATACQQGLAPCAGGPLVGYAGDRFAPSAATAPFALEESLDQPATSQEIRLANLPAAAGGGFVLAWENDQYCDPQSGLCTGGDGSGSGIAARLFRSAQSPAGPSFQVNTTIAGDQAHPAVAALPNGGFVIVWQGRIGDASAWDLYAQRFNAQAEPLGNELQIPEGLTGDVARSAVAAAADGSFLVAFRRLVDVAPALFVRHFAADGTPDANDVEVDGGADGGLPSDPALTALPGGGYAITWRSDLLSSPTANIWVRRLDVTGLPSGDPVAANLQAVDSPTAGIEPVLPDLAADAAGGLLAVWPNHAAATAGGSMVPIHATYFGSPTDAPSREILVAQVNFPLSPRVVSDGDHAYAVVWSRITTSHGVASQLYEGRRSIVPGGTCTAGTAALCLSGHRFRVEVRWNDPHTAGHRGDGSALSFSDATGFFWFFDPGNIELIVKVLDGRALDQSFWLFYGALSDVEYWIRAVDTATGELAAYHNPPGTICGRGDTLAFPQDSSGDGGGVLRGTDFPRASPQASGSCSPSTSTLCLLDGRFAAQVQWKNQHGGGVTGAGQTIPETDASGGFWFFDPGNVELVVKVLDGRALTGKFWVFYGALSDVEYTLTVTDTVTGDVKGYHNAPGNLCGVGDTSALL